MAKLKYIATFLLGAAAGYGLFKYNSMTDEEKEKLYTGLKAKGSKLKHKAKLFFNDLLKKKETGSNNGTV